MKFVLAIAALALLAACSTSGSSATALPSAQALACWGQAAANVSTDALAISGNPAGAAVSSAASAALGYQCNGGAPVSTPVPASAS